MKSKLYTVLIVVLGMFISNINAADSTAQTLAGFAPEDSIIYLAGSGSEKLADEFSQTVLHDLINDQSVKAFVDQIKAVVLPKLDIEDGKLEHLEFAKQLLNQTRVLKDPVLLGAVVNNFDPKNMIFDGYIYYVTTGGAQKVETFKSLINDMIEEHDVQDDIAVSNINVPSVGSVAKYVITEGDKDDPAPVFSIAIAGEYMILVFTVSGQEDLILQQFSKNIKSGPKAVKVFNDGDLSGDDIIMVYNYNRYFNFIEQMMSMEDSDESRSIRKMFDNMKLNELGTLYYRVGFEGKQIVLDVYGDQLAGSAFSGFYRSINKELIKYVPYDSTGFALVNYDFNKLIDFYIDMFESLDEDAIADAREEFNEFQDEIGVDISEGLLNNITGEILAAYNTDINAGMLASSLSYVVTVKDSNLFNDTFDKLTAFAKTKLEDAPVSVSFSLVEKQGKEVRSILVPQLSMFGLQPTIVKLDDTHLILSTSEAAAFEIVNLWSSGDKSKSILANPKYIKAVAQIPNDLYSLQYTDSEVFLKSMSTTMNSYWPMLNMLAGQKGIVLPSMLPQVNSHFDNLPPAVTWSYQEGETGVRTRIKTDAVAIATIGSAYVGGVGGAIMLPAMQKARTQAKAVVCMNNLKSIAAAITVYSVDNDKYPKEFDELGDYINDKALKCPEHNHDYIYRGNDLSPGCDSPHKMVLVYCADHIINKEDHAIVAFCDGHVERVSLNRFNDIIENDNKLRTEQGLTAKPAEGIANPKVKSSSGSVQEF